MWDSKDLDEFLKSLRIFSEFFGILFRIKNFGLSSKAANRGVP